MKVNVDSSTSKIYNLDCKPIKYTHVPLGAMYCSLSPGESSLFHRHYETESFVFYNGQGRVEADSSSCDVKAGDVVKLSPFDGHKIYNDSSNDNLEFVAVWWEPDDQSIEEVAQDEAPTLVISTPPTPNGDLHLGHLSGPYLGADVYKRFLERSGKPVFHMTGRDDNQSYVLKKAQVEGKLPEEIADDFGSKIFNTLSNANIPLSYYANPANFTEHTNKVKKVFLDLYNKGYIYEKEVNAYFDKDTDMYLHEAFIRGDCHVCGEKCDGNACEQCGQPNDCIEIKNPVSTLSQQKPTVKRVKKLYFKFSQFSEALKNYVDETSMSPHVRKMCNDMLSSGLPDICVSHITEWGIDIPIEGYERQRVYVWFEMAAGYLAAAEAVNTDGLEKDYPGFYQDKSTNIVHFYGFDNSYYHTLLFPAIYLALDEGISLPTGHVTNELLNLESKKFSTSRNHLIWARDLLSKSPTDYVRWYLCKVRPESCTRDFTVDGYVGSINSFFVDRLNGVVDSFLELMKSFSGNLPEPGAWSSDQKSFYNNNLALSNAILSHYKADLFSPNSVCDLAEAYLDMLARFSVSQSYYVTDKASYDYLRTYSVLFAWSIKNFALVLSPIIPDFSEKLLSVIKADKSALIDDFSFYRNNKSISGEEWKRFEEINKDDFGDIVHYES